MIFTQASNVNNSIYGKAAAPIRMCIEQKAEAFEEQSLLPKIFRMDTSTNWGERVTSVTAASGLKPVGENGATPKDTMTEGYPKTFEHMTWKDSFEITREMVDDTSMLDLRNRPQNFVTAAYRTREEFGAALVAGAMGGETSINYKGMSFSVAGADGLPVFSTAHPAKVRGDTQTNLFANDFSMEALTKAQAAMKLFKGDNREILNIAPKTIIIPVDWELQQAVYQVVGSHEQPGTPNNGNNVQFGMWNVISWPYLNQFIADGVKPWILFDEDYNEANAGNMWLDRVEMEFTQRVDENTHALVHDVYARWSAGFADWRQMCVGGIPGGTTL